MNYKPKFSIILPTFNRSYILWKAIQSVVNQTYPYWELIVIDDGSTDSTYKMVREFKDDRIKYFYENNGGPCVARNKGLEYTRGDWICYLDNDNEYREDYLYYLNEHLLHSESAKFGFCNQNVRWELYDNKGDLLKYAEESSSFGEEISLKDIVNRTKRFDTNGMFHVRNAVIKWQKAVKYMHDWELLLQLANLYPNGFIHVPLSLVKYFSRYGRDGMCANVSYKEWQNDYIQIYKLHKTSKYRPSDDWFAEKIKKYDDLIKTSDGRDAESRAKKIFDL